MTQLLIVSSFIFLTNSLSTYYFEYYNYSFLFGSLTITSIIYHYNTNIYTNLMDKICIIGIVVYGGHLLYKKTNNENKFYVGCIIFLFLTSIYLYYYGYCTNNYCYHPDKCIGNKYHCALHCISSIAHHMITFL